MTKIKSNDGFGLKALGVKKRDMCTDPYVTSGSNKNSQRRYFDWNKRVSSFSVK